MSPNSSVIILWVYIVLLLAGGLMGFLKAGSKISLITSAAFALPLALCALNVIPLYPIAPILLGLLALVFGGAVCKREEIHALGFDGCRDDHVSVIVSWLGGSCCST